MTTHAATVGVRHGGPAARTRHASRGADTLDPRLRTASRIAVAMLLVTTAVAVVASVALQPEQPIPHAWAQVTVTPGSTLWDIARAHPVSGLSTAETVRVICSQNALSSPAVMAGQVIAVPSDVSPDSTYALR